MFSYNEYNSQQPGSQGKKLKVKSNKLQYTTSVEVYN